MISAHPHCSDTKGGAFAPRDGVRHCERFTECIGCPNFVVVVDGSNLSRTRLAQIVHARLEGATQEGDRVVQRYAPCFDGGREAHLVSLDASWATRA